jgi:hypothetical protein
MMVSRHKLDVLDGKKNLLSEAPPGFMSSHRWEGKQEMVWRQGVGGVGVGGDKYKEKKISEWKYNHKKTRENEEEGEEMAGRE